MNLTGRMYIGNSGPLGHHAQIQQLMNAKWECEVANTSETSPQTWQVAGCKASSCKAVPRAPLITFIKESFHDEESLLF